MLNKIKLLLHHPRPFRLLLGAFLYRSGLSRFVVMRFSGYKLRYFRTVISRSLFINRKDRESDELFFKQILSDGDVAIDVGANIGQLCILASTLVGKKGQVHAFEPHPRIFSFLQRNVQLNELKNVNLYNKALGAEAGELFFTNLRADDVNSVSRTATSVVVEATTLDAMFVVLPPIRLLKIDTEGFELMVLRGAERLLPKVKIIYFEASTSSYAAHGYSFKEVCEFLAQYGFQVFEKSSASISSITELKGRNHNLIAVRDIEDLSVERNMASR